MTQRTTIRPSRLAMMVGLVALTVSCTDGGNDANDDAATPPPTEVASASNATSIAGATTTTITAPASPGYEPVYVVVACDGGPFVGSPQFAGAVCGTLTVPENRLDPAGRQVVLPVQIFPAIDVPGVGVPVVFLSGGPGEAAIGGDWNDRVVARDRELIVVDQRGTGRSVPSLNCAEVDEASVTDSAAGAALQDRAAHEATALAACYTRLRAQADLSQYDTPTVAADFIDLRAALGLDTWVLFGFSYGTAVAQQMMRQDPQHVEAAILDSVVPPDVDDGPGALSGRIEAAFERLFVACAADAACNAAHPDLREKLVESRERLNASPHSVSYTDEAGVQRVALLTGDVIVQGAFRALYDSSLIPLLPFFIDQLYLGNDSIIDGIAGPLLANSTTAAEGVTRSVLCADRHRLAGTATDAPADPLVRIVATDDGCSAWPVELVPVDFSEIPTTAIATLVLAGEMDPAAPASEAARAASALGSRATFVQFPTLGHGALFANAACPTQVANAFLANPSAVVDAACLSTMPPIAWAK